jgi:hypothetical protein
LILFRSEILRNDTFDVGRERFRLDTQTHGTFGRLGLGSPASDDLQRSLANNLRPLLAGSDLCEVIWKRWVTPWGRCLSRPHASLFSMADNIDDPDPLTAMARRTHDDRQRRSDEHAALRAK